MLYYVFFRLAVYPKFRSGTFGGLPKITFYTVWRFRPNSVLERLVIQELNCDTQRNESEISVPVDTVDGSVVAAGHSAHALPRRVVATCCDTCKTRSQTL